MEHTLRNRCPDEKEIHTTHLKRNAVRDQVNTEIPNPHRKTETIDFILNLIDSHFDPIFTY